MWAKAIKKLVCLHILVAALLFLLVEHDKQAKGMNKDRLLAAVVLIGIATGVCALAFIRCTAMAISGQSEMNYTRI